MVERSMTTKTPVPWLPAGLISCYAPGGMILALVTPWIALVGGARPRLKTAWHGYRDPLSRSWMGGDFVVNIPYENWVGKIRTVMDQGKLCLDFGADLGLGCSLGVAAVAPRITECAIQIECVGGRLVDAAFDTELCGDVVRLHRGTTVINPADIPDLCDIQPLCPLKSA